MATIQPKDEAKIYQIKEWLGLNESPDGDTGLKLGEASVMRNFRITREKHLQIRPGYATMLTLAEGSRVEALWRGYVDGETHLLASCGGHLWKVTPDSPWTKTDLGAIGDGPAHLFGFAKNLYVLSGGEFYRWTGTGEVAKVAGYIPIVMTASPPEGGGPLLERINLLTGKKRAQYSPDGTAKVFQLPEKGLKGVESVTGTSITWTADLDKGTVSFATAPEKGVNSITIQWEKGEGQRGKVTKMCFSELYNGISDGRVFLYGDGSNEAIYSGLDENGQPTAEYFPDLNVMAVDSANAPITAMIRHYDRLIVFKEDSAYAAQYATMTLADGSATSAFYASPMNKELGCSAMGQTKLVRNNPRTVFGRSIYEWGLAYGAARDERNAKRLSQRVEATLGAFDIRNCILFDDEEEQEFYILSGGKALVNNYGSDTWYFYTNTPMAQMVKVEGELYFGTPDGRLMHLSRRYRNDDTAPIDAYWESGSMDFGQEWMRKYSSNVWVGLKPESQALVMTKVQSNVKSDYVGKIVSAGLSTMVHANFAHWSFGTNRKPQTIRVRLKVKKLTYYKLIFESKSSSATATILSADIEVRYTGKVK